MYNNVPAYPRSCFHKHTGRTEVGAGGSPSNGVGWCGVASESGEGVHSVLVWWCLTVWFAGVWVCECAGVWVCVRVCGWGDL